MTDTWFYWPGPDCNAIEQLIFAKNSPGREGTHDLVLRSVPWSLRNKFPDNPHLARLKLCSDCRKAKVMLSDSEQTIAPDSFVRCPQEEVKMEAIRLTYFATGVRNQANQPKSEDLGIRHAIQAVSQRWPRLYFSVAVYLSIVAAVAIYDMILTIQYWRSLKQMEANPVGRWLMNLDHIADGRMPNLTLFITLKSIGTLFVLATILTLVLRRSRIGHPVAVGVSSFQLGLAAYLTYGDN